MFVQLGLQLISDMSIRIYSEASIAENPLLSAGFLFRSIRNFYIGRRGVDLYRTYLL